MKIALLTAEYEKYKQIDSILLHTGQHYDEKMSDLFFDQLGIPEPDINLEVGSASHAVQTAEIMISFETVVMQNKPDAILVVGDVNSIIACGLVVVKLGIKLIHVEAGLRSFDCSMPEEINRVLTDSISDFLFSTEQISVENLLQENISEDIIFLVGNVMIDTLFRNVKIAEKSNILDRLSLDRENFAVLTLHRPSNVDNKDVFSQILDALEVIQKETTILKIPCLTLRENTERPITTEIGSNRLVGTDKRRIIQTYKQVVNDGLDDIRVPPLWDGHAAERIVKTLLSKLHTH